MAAIAKAERERIEQEVLETLDLLITGCERLDMERAFSPFSRSPEFRMIAADGTSCRFDEYYANNVAYLRSCTSFSLATTAADVLVLRSDVAVLTWTYRVEATLESGARDMIDHAGATLVFAKDDGAWKVVRYHESSAPTRRESAAP